MARNCTVDRLLACYEYDSIVDLIPSLFWLEDWEDEPAKKAISDYWYKYGDELIENARKFLEQEDAKVGIIFDTDFLNKQNAA